MNSNDRERLEGVPARAPEPGGQPAQAGSARPRAWQRMLSGRRLDLLHPEPGDVDIVDIAHGLARVARWNGQTRGTYVFSVAQHACLVTEIARELSSDLSPATELMLLLHDAPEYVVGDLISPFKAAIGDDYKRVERRLLAAIHGHFGLDPEPDRQTAALIKTADRIAAYFEATALAGFEASEALVLFCDPRAFAYHREPDRALLEPWPTERAQQTFLERCIANRAG